MDVEYCSLFNSNMEKVINIFQLTLQLSLLYLVWECQTRALFVSYIILAVFFCLEQINCLPLQKKKKSLILLPFSALCAVYVTVLYLALEFFVTSLHFCNKTVRHITTFLFCTYGSAALSVYAPQSTVSFW